jgi:tRNA threonylcarbamoyladenosine modification (KEOPS) complex  Pcc1 subunit
MSWVAGTGLLQQKAIKIRSKCSIEIEFQDEKTADAAASAISHEGDVGTRSKTKITKKGSILTIHIDALDVVAMRATANACLRAVQIFEAIKD